jgi:hypothetical protein
LCSSRALAFGDSPAGRRRCVASRCSSTSTSGIAVFSLNVDVGGAVEVAPTRNRMIGRSLWVSPEAGGHRVEGSDAKIGASRRAAATLFAIEHDLLESPER